MENKNTHMGTLNSSVDSVSENIKALSNDVVRLADLKMQQLHERVVSDNNSLIEEVKSILNRDDISEKQRYYTERFLASIAKWK